MAVAPNGDVVVVGWFNGPTFEIGVTTLANPSSPALAPYVARFDSNGLPLWAKTFDGPDTISDVEVTSSGDLLLAGSIAATLALTPCQPLTATDGYDAFVAKLDAGGTCMWSRMLDGQGGAMIYRGLGVDASGNAVVAGSFAGTADFGNGPVTAGSGADLFVGKYSASSGAHLWSVVAGGPTSFDLGRPILLALDGAGDIVLSGVFTGPLNLGGGALPFPGPFPIFVAKLAGGSGAHLYSTSFAGPGDNRAASVAVSPATGSVLAAGIYTGVADFGTGPTTAAQPNSTYLLSMGPVP